MPELPEVETIKRGLANFCLRQKIKRVEINCAKSFIGPSEIVEGKEITGFRRFGKALVIDLAGGISLMIHLRMTGQLIYDGAERYAAGHPSDNFTDKLPNKQTRVVFELTKGTLYFNDQRKFGFVKVLPTNEVEEHKNAPIKAVILDQKIICGLGNIYADEALYDAKIHPRTLAGKLGPEDAKRLLESACKVMDASINSGGSTMKTYVKADGTKGDYLEKFAKVFRREGEPCERCGAEIKKIRVAGRGTHICPCCQVEDKND